MEKSVEFSVRKAQYYPSKNQIDEEKLGNVEFSYIFRERNDGQDNLEDSTF